MKFANNQAFVNQFLVGILVTLGFGGSVGVGTVWMRHQISVVADTNRELEQQYHEIERRADDISAQVESALTPDVLRAQNVSMGLGLVEMTQGQITSVPMDPIPRLVAKANRRVFEHEASANGIAIQFNVPGASLSSTPAADGDHDRAPAPVSHPVSASPVMKGHANAIQFATNP